MPPSAKEEALQVANALNELGHIGCGQPLDEARQTLGDTKLKDMLHEAATICLELIQRTEQGSNPEAFPRSSEARTALLHMRDMLPSLDWDDAASLAMLRADARRALEALGFQLPT